MDQARGRTLDTRPRLSGRGSSILPAQANDQPELEGGEAVFNPLAIGVTVGGLLLDVVAPRPKPRVGTPDELSLLSSPSGSRTPRPSRAPVEHDGPLVASGCNT